MTLAPGTRVGVYEVVALLGVGGMGAIARNAEAGVGQIVGRGGVHWGARSHVHSSTPLTQTPFDEGNSEISPDGRWLAY